MEDSCTGRNTGKRLARTEVVVQMLQRKTERELMKRGKARAAGIGDLKSNIHPDKIHSLAARSLIQKQNFHKNIFFHRRTNESPLLRELDSGLVGEATEDHMFLKTEAEF